MEKGRGDLIRDQGVMIATLDERVKNLSSLLDSVEKRSARSAKSLQESLRILSLEVAVLRTRIDENRAANEESNRLRWPRFSAMLSLVAIIISLVNIVIALRK